MPEAPALLRRRSDCGRPAAHLMAHARASGPRRRNDRIRVLAGVELASAWATEDSSGARPLDLGAPALCRRPSGPLDASSQKGSARAQPVTAANTLLGTAARRRARASLTWKGDRVRGAPGALPKVRSTSGPRASCRCLSSDCARHDPSRRRSASQTGLTARHFVSDARLPSKPAAMTVRCTCSGWQRRRAFRRKRHPKSLSAKAAWMPGCSLSRRVYARWVILALIAARSSVEAASAKLFSGARLDQVID